MSVDLEAINELYTDNQKCAEFAGLLYSSDEMPGILRIKQGKSFKYLNHKNKVVSDKTIKARIAELVIPPAWQKVWICSDPDAHILVTGIDEKGRKQYIYHPKWRRVRDLINFYRLIVFAEQLSKVRKYVEVQLGRHKLDREQVIALLLWVLDRAYIRIGNEVYYEQNESIGLTTMTKQNVNVKGRTITFSFRGKSSKKHHIELTNKRVAHLINKLLAFPGPRLFKANRSEVISASDCNKVLHELTDGRVTAKEFRTWGGTLAAFIYLRNRINSNKKPEKLVLKAIDRAAEKLGNTRTVARAHYVHPHILGTYTQESFAGYYGLIKPKPSKYLHESERELLEFLKLLLDKELDLLRVKKKQNGRG